ncbi:hypothetical protein HPB49_004637 [Dermacentor silvarum]|uniref:Uncharacterized protein n=1 Tax=Dermacentor silvarum TaxID=543639 RepID=A0ACB8CPY8_DERSI|nr:hypothetical protein HPB49_004637 [Dermacentor silvarum]
MAAMDDNFAEFVNYLDRHDEILSGAAFSYASPPRRVPRDRLNPMEVYDEYEFLCRFRFSKSAVQQLLAMLPLRDNTDGRGLPVPPLLQLLITLRFYGAGTFQIVTGDLVNVSQPTVSRVIERVSTMIARSLFPALVKFPSASEVYRNRKGYFSINVQGITGPDLQFYDVVASWPGSAHDSRIFDCSRARVLYETGIVPGILLGDMGYACRPYLMTPLKDPAQGSPEYRQVDESG